MKKRLPLPIQTDQLCHYGCGNTAKYIIQSNKLICESSPSKCQINRAKNSKGVKNTYKNGRNNSIIYENLPQESKDKMAWNRNKIFKADFSLNGTGKNHKKILILERGHCCQNCNNQTWLGEPIPLELEHCDGNNRNNLKENLLLLCPNCHAKTRFYRGKNINSGKLKVSDEEILNEIKKGLNNRQILLNVNLTPKGANYERINNLRNSIT